MERRSEHGTRNLSKEFLEWFGPDIYYTLTVLSKDECFMILMKLTLPRFFCYRSISTFWNIFGGLYTQIFRS